MKKIWDSESNQHLYAIDADALKHRVLKKKKRAAKVAGYSEKFLAGAMFIAAGIIVVSSIIKSKYEFVPLLLAGVMYGMMFFIIAKRNRRMKWQNTYDNSVLGDLDEAIANAEYQVNLSYTSRLFLFIVYGLTLVSLVDTVEDWWKGLLLIAFFGVVYFAARWEHRTFYVSQKRNLKAMRDKFVKLESEKA